MAALAAYAEGPESWDEDPDLDLPSGPLLHPSHLDPALTLEPPSDSEPASPAASHDFDDADGFFERVAGEWDDRPRTREEENESSVDSSRTNTTTGTLKGLMEGLSLDHPEADTTLSLDETFSASPPRAAASFEADATPRTSKTTTLHKSSPLSLLLAASRSPSGRGKVHHLGSTPHGQAQPVDDGDWDQDLEGLDALQLGGRSAAASEPGLRVVAKKGSFASHICLEDEDDDNLSAFDEPAGAGEEKVARKRISIASFTDAEDNGDGEDDFELPAALSHVSLTPNLANRPSNVSLKSDVSAADAPPPQLPRTPTTPAALEVPASHHPAFTSASSAPSSPGPLTPSRSSDDDGPSSSALEDDDDADFFDDLVLPSYFLAAAAGEEQQKRASTPPTSDGEPDSDAAPAASKVDLQSILRAKLEARGGRGLLFHPPGAAAPASPQEQERLERHREKDDDGDGADLSRELRRSSVSDPSPAAPEAEAKDEEWSVREMRERMRTISGARAREAQQAREAREASRAASRIGVLRRTASDGKVPPLPGRRGVPPLPARASTAVPAATRSSIIPQSHTGARSGLPQPVRPASAHGTERPPSAASSHSTESGATRRRGPPPAPSAASRGRVRTRTTSLRTVPSSPDLRTAATSRTRPAKLDLPAAPSSSSKRSLSPVPMTPATPSGSNGMSLRSKRSQQHLSAAAAASATSARTLERKRSLQNLSALASPTPGAPAQPSSSNRPRSRQNSLRSPSPSGTHLPSFAAPTASSALRIRDRVQSNPVPYIPPSPSTTSLTSLVHAAPSRPPPTPSRNSTLSERLLRPTLASASKTRTLPRPTSPLKPSLSPSPRLPSSAQSGFLSGIRLPSASLTLSRPLSSRAPARAGTYGDGTELDGFDDLPVSKERERKRVVPPAGAGSASRKSSGASTATLKGGSWGRKEGARIAPRASAEKKPGTVQGRKEAAVEKEKAAKGKEREREKKAGDPEKKKVKKRREPHLIRHLGGASAIKVQGEMTYNPVLQRWEGNEAILREFDKALATSTRPALISPFSSTLGSPHRGSFFAPVQPAAQPASAAITANPKVVLPAGATASASRGTAKVVGDMVFDPATCSWHAVAGPDAEDELELDWGGGTSGGEAADDEDAAPGGLGAMSEVDGWELGERERMLKNRASFVLEEGSEEEVDVGAEAADGAKKRAHTTKKQIWRESKAAEERSRVEMSAWRTSEPEEGEGRKWLWELRALVMDIH
ncbi:hypothetical protein JCM10449v2_000735 [Rhodotorula kratochvilovae]